MSRQTCLTRTAGVCPSPLRIADLNAERIARAPIPEFAAPAETTVIAHDFGAVLADVKAADLSEADQRAQTLRSVRSLLEKLGSLEIAEVLAVVDVLRNQCDGDSSVALQECGEALEGDLPAVQAVLRKIDVAEAAGAAYPQLVPLQAVK